MNDSTDSGSDRTTNQIKSGVSILSQLHKQFAAEPSVLWAQQHAHA